MSYIYGVVAEWRVFSSPDLWSVSLIVHTIHSFGYSLGLLTRKTNMEPEGHPFEKTNHLPTLQFCVPSSWIGCKAFMAESTLSIQCSSSWEIWSRAMARSMNLLPMVLLALGAWMLSSLTSQSGFVMNTATPRGSKVAMRGFKDDFYAWKETLSSEDQALLLKQAQNASWPRHGKVLTNIWGCMPLW